MRTVGVEEELLLMDAHDDDTRPVAAQVLLIASARGDTGEPTAHDHDDPQGSLVHELQQQQLETNTSPHADMTALEEELLDWRGRAASAAHRAGVRLVASGTSPVPVVPQPVPDPRYDQMAQRFGIVAREQLTCGCHVHVSVASADEAVGVLDRVRVWLPILLALSANSPFWQGQDSDYASFRAQAMGRWPTSGPNDVFGSAHRYRALVDSMLATGVILDEGMLYSDIRCSASYPTVEFRIADVCLSVRDAVLVAALCRGLVDTAAAEWAAGEPAPAVPTPLVRLASWQAARWGVDDQLLDPRALRPAPAREVITALVEHVRPALVANGDETLVEERVERIVARGNGATQQRQVFERSGQLGDVVGMLIEGTVGRDGIGAQ